MKHNYKIVLLIICILAIIFLNDFMSTIYEPASSKEARLYRESQMKGTSETPVSSTKSETTGTSTIPGTPAVSGTFTRPGIPDDLKSIFATSYTEAAKIVCENGTYKSNGICCPTNMVNIKGNCMSMADANSKYQKDISQLIDINYHESDIDLMKKAQSTDVQFGNMNIYDDNGNTIAYPASTLQGSITYYTPGSYPFGPSNYVPKYEDSIYLSKLTGLPTTTPVYNTAKMQKGFCNYFENQPREKETVCNQLSSDECASTNCCVLLGGSKCVAGNISGPTFKSNYGDTLIQNKDSYFYQGECYGNCK